MELLERFTLSLPATDTVSLYVSNYFKWQARHLAAAFTPGDDDDIDLRTYLLDLYTHGADQTMLEEQVQALKRFYHWLHDEGCIEHSPFDDYSYLNPLLNSEQVLPRQQALASDPKDRELDRLHGLYKIADVLISSVDIRSALDSTLKILLQVMNLQTGWVSAVADSPLGMIVPGDAPLHGMVLAAAHGLPPGLERNDRQFMRRPPACRCQQMLLAGRLTRPVNIVDCTRLSDARLAVGDTQGLQFHASAPLISNGKPLGLINVATTDWKLLTNEDLRFLSDVSARLVATIDRAHFYEVAESRRILLEKELMIAREVQAGLMPAELPEIPGFSVACAWHPARQVAGDFYDIFPLDEHRWGIVIGDVAGKGTAAALYMAMVRSLILSGALRHSSPAAAMMEVNQTILRQSPKGIFVTITFAVLDSLEHTLCYANAGHNPPILRRLSGKQELLTRTGAVLGLFEGLQLTEATVALEPGDAVVFFTDGVTECWNSHRWDEEYGDDRLTAAVAAAPRQAGELLAHLEADLHAFTKGVPQQDDVTFLVLARD